MDTREDTCFTRNWRHRQCGDNMKDRWGLWGRMCVSPRIFSIGRGVKTKLGSRLSLGVLLEVSRRDSNLLHVALVILRVACGQTDAAQEVMENASSVDPAECAWFESPCLPEENYFFAAVTKNGMSKVPRKSHFVVTLPLFGFTTCTTSQRSAVAASAPACPRKISREPSA